MKNILLIALVATGAFAQEQTEQSPPKDCRARDNRTRLCPVVSGPVVPPPAFAFAPTSGAGMGTECGCTAVTGSQGEVATMARASSAYCTIGNEFSGLSTSSMTICSNNVPRVMRGGDGTGVLGVLIENGTTNYILRSEEFENAAWSPINVSIAAPTITANTSVAPNGTTTADRIQIASTIGNAGAASYIYQAVCPAGTDSGSLYVKGTSGSGSIYLALGNSFTNPVLCSFNSSTWTRCRNENRTFAGTNALQIGVSPLEGSGQLAAIDVQVWGAQCESTSMTTSYVATVGSAVARQADNLRIAASGITDAAGSFAATFNANNTNMGNSTFGTVISEAAGTAYQRRLDWQTSTPGAIFQGVSGVNTPFGTIVLNQNRIAGWWTSNKNVRFNGVDQLASALGTMGTGITAIEIGNQSNGNNPMNGVVSQVCVDNSDTKCR